MKASSKGHLNTKRMRMWLRRKCNSSKENFQKAIWPSYPPFLLGLRSVLNFVPRRPFQTTAISPDKKSPLSGSSTTALLAEVPRQGFRLPKGSDDFSRIVPLHSTIVGSCLHFWA